MKENEMNNENKTELINKIKNSSIIHLNELKEYEYFIKNNFIKKFKNINNVKFLILQLFNFNLWFVIFTILNIQVNTKNTTIFLAIVLFVSLNIFIVNKIKNLKYDDYFDISKNDEIFITKWIEEKFKDDQLKIEIIKNLNQQYIKDNKFNMILLKKDLYELIKKTNEKEKLIDKIENNKINNLI